MFTHRILRFVTNIQILDIFSPKADDKVSQKDEMCLCCICPARTCATEQCSRYIYIYSVSIIFIFC